MDLRFTRGATCGKQKDLQMLAKIWWVSVKDDKGHIAKNADVKWEKANFSQSVFHKKEQIIEEINEFLTWSDVIGLWFGEKNALRAVKRGDYQPKTVTMANGQSKKMWERVRVAGAETQTKQLNLAVSGIYLIYKLSNLIYKLGKYSLPDL